MTAPDWFGRWNEGRIGFHRDTADAHLGRYLGDMAGPASCVLVPLCGKSVDMTFLAEKGHRVIGVELVPAAAQAYFAERGITAENDTFRDVACLRGGGVEIVVSDITTLDDDAFSVDAVWDRAALIALPPALRVKYARKVVKWMRPEARMLLNTLTYDAGVMAGPPFSVGDGEVRDLYAERCDLRRLYHGAAQGTPRAGPDASFEESVWCVTRR